MFNAFSIISSALLPTSAGGSPLEPIRRPATSHQRPSPARASGSRPQSMVADLRLPTNRPASLWSSTTHEGRPRSQLDQVGVSAARPAKRLTVVIPEDDEPRTRDRVYRWDGIIGARSDWDCIRRDQELWTPEGDALIHLYARGGSRRGPSLRLAFTDIEQCKCERLLAESLVQGASAWELYLPAPYRLDRVGALLHHLTTRNLFAWMFDRPLVGPQLGTSLIALHQRLDLARGTPAQNALDMLAYIDSQGYADFAENADHAMGALVYAEHYQLVDLWIDAFVHGVGQYEHLSECPDWPSVSPTTKALLARASCEMTVRLQRASRDLSSFMEPSMSTFEFSDDVRRHLDRFRSFLHTHFVQSHGYWPPRSDSGILSYPLLRSMYSEFQALYDLLADKEPEATAQLVPIDVNVSRKHIDVPHLLGDYNRRFRHGPLPCTIPLFPSETPTERDGILANMFFPSFGAQKRSRIGRRAAAVSALQQASNASIDPGAASSPLARAYVEFERTTTLSGEEKLSPRTARAARWVLIYATLQTLISVTQAPPQVRDVEDVSYPLCCQTAGTPPWSTTPQSQMTQVDEMISTATLEASLGTSETLEERPESAPSPVPSAIVPPLDLRAVADKRRSLNCDAMGIPILVAPRPQRPVSTGALAALDVRSSVDVPYYPLRNVGLIGDDDVGTDGDDIPPLSPSSEIGEHSGSSSSESSPSEVGTPRRSEYDDQDGRDAFYIGAGRARADSERFYDAPPSPSIYEESFEPARSEIDLLRGGQGEKSIVLDSEELAARWRGELGM